MTDAELLTAVKNALCITTNYQDAILTIYINEVKDFMKDAGVPSDVLTSSAAVGCISRGVNDLWNYGAGVTKLSGYFKQRVIQLASGR